MPPDGASQVLLSVAASAGEGGGTAGSSSAADDGEPAPPSEGGGVGCACSRPGLLTFFVFLAAAGALVAAVGWFNNAAAADAQAAAGRWFSYVASVEAKAAVVGWVNHVAGMVAQGRAIGVIKRTSSRTPGNVTELNESSNVTEVDMSNMSTCSAMDQSCLESRCCSDEGMQCYAKDDAFARCKPSCVPGPDMQDLDGKHWSCQQIGPRTPGMITEVDTAELPFPSWARWACSSKGEDCSARACCKDPGHQCFGKSGGAGLCRVECEEDSACEVRGPRTPGRPRLGSFLVIGDWGWDPRYYGDQHNYECQASIARLMDRTMGELGDVRFVVNVGDSFYPVGVVSKSDPQWETKWRSIYSFQLRSVPWYSVYGNHDLFEASCACSEDVSQCAQVNYDEDNRDFFVMPGPSYYKEFPDLGIEIVGLDLNHFALGDRAKSESELKLGVTAQCISAVRNRTQQGFDLFFERAEKSNATSLVVFSHYPTDYFSLAPKFLAGLRDNSRYGITYFGGHRHSTDNDSTTSTRPNTNWVVGGGGGWGCDSDKQGFVVGEVHVDGSVSTRAVLVPPGTCCAAQPLGEPRHVR
ncbi:unnamed protein product [Prorocentrum cordatum]|uniref:Calcineurin-like phosphoesterase domain-containing protein n=1 Tax=Prorocentrum cordatum TaxID=2364126 RepID=A0ABN9X6V4_9DINO|nr:unnamed protein product [Polarella glacialis]